MHELTGLHLIEGRWTPTDGRTFTAINPSTGEALPPTFAEAGEEQVDAAAQAAAEALAAAADLLPHWPADLLDVIVDRIQDLGDLLLERAEQETALPRARLTGERARTVSQLQMLARIAREGSWVEATIDTADPDRRPLPKPDLRRMLRPRGPVAVFGAGNFPFAFGVCGGDTASALAAGNPVIIKGHPSHPGTSELFAAAVRAALDQLDLPRGLFALLQGTSHALSGALVKHPQIAAVGFTGSHKAGRALFDLAAAREKPIPVYAEMGSVNPVFILPGALAERVESIARDLAGSILMGGGQFCTKPGVVFTIGDDNDLVQLLARHIGGQPPVTMLNRPLRENLQARLDELAGIRGVHSIARGDPLGNAAIAPSLLQTDAVIWQQEPSLRQEAFGPAAVVVHCNTLNDALACIDTMEGSLTGTVHLSAQDAAAATQVLRRLEMKVGRLIVNGYPTGVEVCHAIVHGGPYPATTDAGTTSVGTAAIRRFVRMVAYQSTPQDLLPAALRDENPLGIARTVNGRPTTAPIASATP